MTSFSAQVIINPPFVIGPYMNEGNGNMDVSKDSGLPVYDAL